MKVVILFGFYGYVFVELQKAYSALLQDQTIMWIGPLGPHGDGNLANLKSLLFDRLEKGFTNVLLLCVVRRGAEASHGERIQEVVRWARARHLSATIIIDSFRYAEAFPEVNAKIREFLEYRSSSEEESFPTTLAEVERWCNVESRRERLLILPRAIDECKNSPFQDAALVYKSLHLLAIEYWDLRVNGGLERKKKWQTELERMGLTVAPSISKSRAGEQRDQYYVNYPPGSPPGTTKFLEQHLKRGNDRDQRFCFRLYFFWDKKKRLVVVGWLPSHLDTRAT